MVPAQESILLPSENPSAVILSLAAPPWLVENSPPGFEPKKINAHPGWGHVNFKTAPGIEPSLRRNGRGPHCQTWNMYAYVRNNPTTLTDPSGEDPNDILGAAVEVANFAFGAANAFGSDNLLGAFRMDQNTTAGQVGAAVGDAVATGTGAAEVVLGSGDEVAGTVLDATGVGALVGVPANVVSAAVIAHGTVTAGEGLVHLARAARVGDFTRGEKKQIDAANAGRNEGTNACDGCGKPVRKAASEKGVPTPGDQLQRHHDPPLSTGASKNPNTAKVFCPDCHRWWHRLFGQ